MISSIWIRLCLDSILIRLCFDCLLIRTDFELSGILILYRFDIVITRLGMDRVEYKTSSSSDREEKDINKC